MKTFIKIKNGWPVDHPMIISNIKDCVDPNFDPDNPGDNFMEFERTEYPSEIGLYEKIVDTGYKVNLINKKVTNTFDIIPYTPEERAAKEQRIKDSWAANGFASWTWDDVEGQYAPPIPYPSDYPRSELWKYYMWRESDTSWVRIATPPSDYNGSNYRFDLSQAVWLPLTE